ncbi:hypothetical protein WDW37_17605 [Bdellovibrionota bacterium FG-1]
MSQNESRLPVQVETELPKISLNELAIDVSAFLLFLSENYDGDKQSEIPSFWMLIPKSLDVEWREGIAEFYLEKEVFSRTLLVIAPPVPNAERQKRRAELLLLFHNAIAEDQMKQILLLLSRLKEESRVALVEKFSHFRINRDSPPKVD